ncbi:MAG: hypothetical protein R3F50_12520 [Gammaproteobacteria bacterium]|jgi:hypothetical protein
MTLTNSQFVCAEQLNGLLEESGFPVDAWMTLFGSDGGSNQGYGPCLTEYW